MPTYMLKNYKQLNTMDGYAFTVSIYADGKRIGTAENGGHGGPNAYDWVSKEARTQFTEDAKAWARANEENPDYGEIGDLFLETLIDQREYQRIAKSNAKKGFPVTLVFFQGPQWFSTSNQHGKPDYYLKTFTLGVRDDATVAVALEKYKPAKHLVVRA